MNLPNLVTLVRLLIAPWVAVCLLNHAFRQALVLLAVAGATDAIDGWLARRFGWSTHLGAYLDPIADKALLVTVYIALGSAGLVPQWLVLIVVGRDMLILAFAGAVLLLTKHRRFDPSAWGKLSTMVQIVTGVAVIGNRAVESLALTSWVAWLPAITAATTGWSGIHYAWRGIRTLCGQIDEVPPQE